MKKKWSCQKFQIENTKVKRLMCITPAKPSFIIYIFEEAKLMYQSSMKLLQTHLANFKELHEENCFQRVEELSLCKSTKACAKCDDG